MAPEEVRMPSTGASAALKQTASGVPLVDVRVHEKRKYTFLVDTGASWSVVSQRLIKELDLVKLPVSFDHFGKPQALYEVNSVELGNIYLWHLLATDDARGAFPEIERSTGLRIDGVLSLHAFKDYLLTLDFHRDRLEVTRGRLTKRDHATIPFRYSRPLVIVPFSDGESTTTHSMVIDTGSAASFQLAANTGSLPYAEKFLGESRYMTYYGRNAYRVSRIDAVAVLGGVAFVHPVVERHQSGADALGENAGAVGMRALEGLRLTFDCRRDLVRIVDGAKP